MFKRNRYYSTTKINIEFIFYQDTKCRLVLGNCAVVYEFFRVFKTNFVTFFVLKFC